MRIVYFGMDLQSPCFSYLAERCEILALYTHHYPEDCFTEYAIVKEAEKRGIPVVYGRISEERVRRYFEEEGCDLFFSAEYGYIIPVPKDLPQFRGVNLHGALLPKGRGYFPVEVTLARHPAETGVTLHKIAPELDTGDIIDVEKFALRPEMDSVDVCIRNRQAGLALTKRLMADFEGAWSRAVPQPPSDGTDLCPRPDDAVLTLKPGMTTAEAMAVYRIYNQMTRVEVGGETRLVMTMEPGSVTPDEAEIRLEENRWIYRTADGHLRLTLQHKED